MPPSPLLERIKPLVHRILSSPSIIPSQVSAKTVRQALIDDHGINKDELTNSKKEVKELILSIFRELYPDEPGGQPDADNNMMLSSPAKGANGDVTMEPATPLKRKRDELIASQSIAPSSPAVPLVEETSQKKNRPKAKKEVDEDDDSEIARKLQKALNGERATRNAGKKRKAGTSSGAEGKKSRVKSKEYVISDNDDSASGSEATGKPVKKRKSKPAEKDGEPGPAKGGFQKPYILRYGLRSQEHLRWPDW
jgi:hypothetical protein